MLIRPENYERFVSEREDRRPYFGFEPTIVYIVRSRARNEEPRTESRAPGSLAPSLTFYSGEARVDALWMENSDVLRRGYDPETDDDQQSLALAWERGWCLFSLSKQRHPRYGDTYRIYAEGEQPLPEEEPLWEHLDLQPLSSDARRVPSGQPQGSAQDRSLPTARVEATLGVESDRRPGLLLDELVKHPKLVEASRKLFVDGHYSRAVEEGLKAVCARVRERTGLTVDGRSLMETAFSEKKPKLRLNDLANRSQRDEQVGHKDLFAGAITGLRNPRAHDHLHTDSPGRALRLLALTDYLFSIVEEASTEEA